VVAGRAASATGALASDELSGRAVDRLAPRRILVVGPVPPPLHGVTVMTAALLRGGLEAEFDVVHADTSDHRTMTNVGSFDIANIVLALRHFVGFVMLLRRHHPDLVYLPLSQGPAGFLRDAALLLAARIAGARAAVHAHGALYREFFERIPVPLRALVRASLAPVRAIAVLGEGQSDQFVGWAPAEATVTVVPNGVADEWPGGPPDRAGHTKGTVLYVSNLLPQKGFLDVLDAVPSVLARAPGVRFVFAGDPHYDEKTARRVNDAIAGDGISEAVTFTGAVSQQTRRDLLSEADIFVFPPRWEEGQGIVVIEAMSAGLPVVVTASGGLAQTVRGGVEGLFVPRSCPQAIADSVVQLLGDESLRARLGSAGRARYESEFTLDRWLCRMRSFLAAALESASDRC
jgi:glycosyltransferase involved in cell wall biosynthesis